MWCNELRQCFPFASLRCRIDAVAQEGLAYGLVADGMTKPIEPNGNVEECRREDSPCRSVARDPRFFQVSRGALQDIVPDANVSQFQPGGLRINFWLLWGRWGVWFLVFIKIDNMAIFVVLYRHYETVSEFTPASTPSIHSTR